MRTKQLIEELQKLDPKGNMPVEMDGGAIFFLDSLPGHCDGPSHRIEKTKSDNHLRYVIDDVSTKIRIMTMGLEDFVTNYYPNYDVVLDVSKSRKKDYLKDIDRYVNEWEALQRKVRDDYLFRIMKRLTEGWHIIRRFKAEEDNDEDLYAPWSYEHRGLNQDATMCGGEIHVVINSGLFDKLVILKDVKHEYVLKSSTQ